MWRNVREGWESELHLSYERRKKKKKNPTTIAGKGMKMTCVWADKRGKISRRVKCCCRLDGFVYGPVNVAQPTVKSRFQTLHLPNREYSNSSNRVEFKVSKMAFACQLKLKHWIKNTNPLQHVFASRSIMLKPINVAFLSPFLRMSIDKKHWIIDEGTWAEECVMPWTLRRFSCFFIHA